VICSGAEDIAYMRMVLELARKSAARPSSEPRIGALAVERGSIVGRAHSTPASAETSSERPDSPALAALRDAGARVTGATLYTNVEPWHVTADRESCVSRLIEIRPARLVIGGTPQESSSGSSVIQRLTTAGIRVDISVLEDECEELNAAYFKYTRTGLPFITVKFAQSLDGRIATSSGDSQWISGEEARRFAHQLRSEVDAVMVGIGTVLADDPLLTVRLVRGSDPLRIVVDSRLRTPLQARMLLDGGAEQTLIATTELADRKRIEELRGLGAEVLVLPAAFGPGAAAGNGNVNLVELISELGRRGVASVLVEGGAGLITSLLAVRRVDRVIAAIAPKIIGRGIDSVGDLGVTKLDQAINLTRVRTRQLGNDLIVEGRIL
jgi:diaminohydroxyphosphoribosylaminopyrimidine deaminase/5-amino-6-(5-phosphoribosylamino)uracil reductase